MIIYLGYVEIVGEWFVWIENKMGSIIEVWNGNREDCLNKATSLATLFGAILIDGEEIISYVAVS